MKTYVYNAITFKVGTNASENWSLISAANKDDYWVHLDGVPSAHVIIEMDQPLQDELNYAAQLCKEQTKFPVDKVMACVATPIKNLKLGSKPGEVVFKSARDTTTFKA